MISLTAITIPILLAALGGLISEQAGKLNIALEGLILAGAFTSAAVLRGLLALSLPAAAAVPAALAAAAGAAAAGGGLIALFHLRYQANLFITALAVNLLVPSLITSLSLQLFRTRGVLRIDGFDGGLLTAAGLPLFLPLTALSAAGLWYFLRRTSAGLTLRTAGASPPLMHLRRLSAPAYQAAALTASGFFCGLAGAFLTLRLGAFVPGISSGRGWVALVIVYLGFRRPGGLLAAALFYAAAESLTILIQGGTGNTPAALLQALPYLLLLVFLLLSRLLLPRKKQGDVPF